METHWSPIVRARTQICPLMAQQAISSIRSVCRGQRAVGGDDEGGGGDDEGGGGGCSA